MLVLLCKTRARIRNLEQRCIAITRCASVARIRDVRQFRSSINVLRSTMHPHTLQQKRAVQVSKELSRLLRHAPPAGTMDTQGWVNIDALVTHMKTKPSIDEVLAVVAINDKQRFVVDQHHQPVRIRAAQGHSIALADPQIAPVTDAAAVPVAVHATSQESWVAIQECGELRRMTRTHIHFATQPSLLRANKWASSFLLLKLQDALTAGHKFFLSANGVLLCEGPLPVTFVQHVTAQEVQRLWSADRQASLLSLNPTPPQ